MATWTDEVIAFGTLGTALVAVVGLFVSLSINKRDRTRADQQARDDRDAAEQRAQADRQAASDLAASDRAAARDDAERRHIIGLLLRLGRQIGRWTGYMNMPQSGEASQQIVLLLKALPIECAHAARQRFDPDDKATPPGALGIKLGHLQLRENAQGAYEGREMCREIAYDIERYLHSGLPPSKVWANQYELHNWNAARWPRH